MKFFNIQMASQLSGVATTTIRAWEKRYNAVTPRRATNKRRLYSEEDIEKLSLLHKLTVEGQNIGNIASFEIDELIKIYTQVLNRPYEKKDVVNKPHSKINSDEVLKNLYLALTTYKLDIFSHELSKAQSQLLPRDYCLQILAPIFRKISEMIIKNEIDPEKEKILSAIFQFYLLQMIGQHTFDSMRDNNLVLITTPIGNWHEVNIMGTALLCIHYGIKFLYLSNNSSASALADISNALKPMAIIIGSSRKSQTTSKNHLSDYLLELQHKLKTPLEIWWGGNSLPDIKSKIYSKNLRLFNNLYEFDKFLADTYPLDRVKQP